MAKIAVIGISGYVGSHNAAAGPVTLTTFGDHHALPRLGLPDVMNSQVERMLDDPKSKRGLHDFVEQWLELAKLKNININN